MHTHSWKTFVLPRKKWKSTHITAGFVLVINWSEIISEKSLKIVAVAIFCLWHRFSGEAVKQHR